MVFGRRQTFMSFYFVQFLTGLSSASSLFLVASGLSIIFGVTRIVNFAHGSFYMLGAFIAYSFVAAFPEGPMGFWGGVLLAALAVGLIGVVMEVLLLRRIYQSPEMFQLVATFGVVLLVKDVALWVWGPEDKLGPRAPGFDGAVDIFGSLVPEYDLAWVMSFENIPQNVSEALLSISDNKFVVLIIINLILLIVGIFMDITPAILIFTPIFLPIVTKLGVDPVHFGIVMVLNLCIGLCTPPVGSVLFVGVSVAKTTIEKVIKPLLPIYIVMVIALLIVTYFPQLSLWLPGLFGY